MCVAPSAGLQVFETPGAEATPEEVAAANKEYQMVCSVLVQRLILSSIEAT